MKTWRNSQSPQVSKNPISTNNEGRKSSEYEERTDKCNVSQRATKSPPAPVDFDSIEDINVEVGNYSSKTDTRDSEGIEDEEATTRNSQENVECGEYDVIAMNCRINKLRNIGNVDEIYDCCKPVGHWEGLIIKGPTFAYGTIINSPSKCYVYCANGNSSICSNLCCLYCTCPFQNCKEDRWR